MKLQRYKPKIKQRLLLFLIAFVLSITAILMTQSPTLIYADSMTESETPGVGASDMGTGISYTRTGWLFYLTYPDGTEASPVKAAFSYDNRFMDTAGNPVNNRALITRMGTRYSDYDAMTINVSWGPPFDSNGNFRGDDVRNFFETDDNGDGHVRAYEFIQVNWDEEWANKWESKEVYLVFEPFYWARLIRDGKTTGYWWAGTSMRWGLVQHYMGINAEDEGDPISKRYTNDIYDNCVILSDCEEIREMGLNAPPHNRIVKNSESMTNDNGWGIGVLWHEPEGIHTYNRVDSPGDPETNDPPRNGTCSIVKGYYTEYKTGNTVTKLTNDGTFYTTMCTNEIFIDDEPEYQIERWNISSATNTSLQSTNGSTVTWNPPSRISESGTTSTVKTLTDTQKCVYVLLKRTIEEEAEPLDANYTLTQSSITRRIHFSNPDAQLSMVKMQNYNFKFLNPAHQTECAGHTYNCDGCQNNSCDCVLADGESCTKDHGKSCPGHTDKCTWGKWTDQTLKLSILNTQKSDYPDILATKQGWNFETQKGGLAKRADTKPELLSEHLLSAQATGIMFVLYIVEKINSLLLIGLTQVKEFQPPLQPSQTSQIHHLVVTQHPIWTVVLEN